MKLNKWQQLQSKGHSAAEEGWPEGRNNALRTGLGLESLPSYFNKQSEAS